MSGFETGLRCPYGCKRKDGSPCSVRGIEESYLGQINECARGHVFLLIPRKGPGFEEAPR